MRLKTTLILVLILIAVASYFFFIEDPGRKKAEEAKTLSSVLLPYGIDEVDRVIFRNPAGDVIEWERADGRWLIVSPVTAEGSSSTIDYFISQLIPGRKMSEFAAEGNFGDFGLEIPYSTVIFFNSKRDRSDTLYVGDKTPLTTQCYVRLGSSDTIAVTRDLTRNLMKKSLYHLRDKYFIHMDTESVTGLSVEGPSGVMHFSRIAGSWLFRGTRMGADKRLIEPYITSISEAIVRKFSAEDLSATEFFGFGQPERSITIYTAGDSTLIRFGREEDNLVYVTRSGQDKIVQLEKKYLHIFDWFKDDLMVMNLAGFIPGEVGEIQIEMPDTSLALKSSGETWVLTSSPSVEIVGGEVEYFLLIVRGLAFEKLLDPADPDLSSFVPGRRIRIILLDRSGEMLDDIILVSDGKGRDLGRSVNSGAEGIIRKNSTEEIKRIIARFAKKNGDVSE